MGAEGIVRGARAVDEPPHPEIMIPLVAYEHELEILRELVVRVASRHGFVERQDYTVGTMIELPRDDAESKFLPVYMEQKIIDRSPFETIDRPGVGWLVCLGAWVGREAHP